MMMCASWSALEFADIDRFSAMSQKAFCKMAIGKHYHYPTVVTANFAPSPGAFAPYCCLTVCIHFNDRSLSYPYHQSFFAIPLPTQV
jgi:hypothetical protein